jgi:hypothetical protein
MRNRESLPRFCLSPLNLLRIVAFDRVLFEASSTGIALLSHIVADDPTTAPNRITPYHIDRESSLLFQIQGAIRLAYSTRLTARCCLKRRSNGSGPWITTPRFTSPNTKAAPPFSNFGPDKASTYRLAHPTGCRTGLRCPCHSTSTSTITTRSTPPHHSAFRDSIKRSFFPPARKAWVARRSAESVTNRLTMVTANSLDLSRCRCLGERNGAGPDEQQ